MLSTLRKLPVCGALLAAAAVLVFGTTARADNYIYGNNAGFGPDTVSLIDVTTGLVTQNYDVSSGNGRGVVVVGNTMYTTEADSNNVYMYNLTTNAPEGVAFSVSGASGLSTMAYDGTNFWIGDYSGTNHVYEYSPTGTLLSTISLADCTGYCDGLEYVAANGGELISNEFDGFDSNSLYDVYSLSGTLLQAGFINSATGCPEGSNGGTTGSTGIAFDGTDFFISCINESQLAEYSSTGVFIKDIPFTGDTNGDGPLVEDLSANYAQVLPVTGTPEPSSLLMLGLGLLGFVPLRRKSSKKDADLA